jgi:polyhydroxyalkanoate synthase
MSRSSNPQEEIYDSLGRLLAGVVEINRRFLESLAGAPPAGADWPELFRAGCADKNKADWLNLGPAFQQAQLDFWNSLLAPIERFFPPAGDSGPLPDDPRFRDSQWHSDPRLKGLMEAYLKVRRAYQRMAEQWQLSQQDRRRLKFYINYFLDALAPTNFFLTNPEAVRLFSETGGQSLLRGLENLAADLRRGRLTQTDEEAFAVGGNLAATPGGVIYANRLMQLIHYRPRRETVRARPLLVVPPCINKFYILDLQARNSFVSYCLDQGLQVFLISWVNPDRRHRDLGWDEYLEEGVLKGIEIARTVAGGEPVNLLGYCVGGTLLACALAVLKARRQARRVASATFLTTLLDFSDPGDIGVFVDRQILARQEAAAEKEGFIPGQDLFHTFSQVRANDLIWSYVVSSYLKGLDPSPFDILYWNCDPVNLPLAFYHFLMHELYLENRLIAGQVRVCGVRVRLEQIRTPAYFMAAIDDHLVSWRTCFQGAVRLPGCREFVLGRGGHVAGVVNPPGKENSFYYCGSGRPQGEAEAWREAAEKKAGSWWEHWRGWLLKRSGRRVAAPPGCGSRDYPVIEPAPGSYVARRLEFAGLEDATKKEAG